MKLSKVDFYLDLPDSIQVIHLRQFIIEKLIKKGGVIRWSIVDIEASKESSNIKTIRIHATLVNPINP